MKGRKKQPLWRGRTRVYALAMAAALLAAATPFASDIVGAVAFLIAVIAVFAAPRTEPPVRRPRKRATRKPVPEGSG